LTEINADAPGFGFELSQSSLVRRKIAMSPSDIRLAVDAHREAIEALTGYFIEFPMVPRYIVQNHIAFEVAHRIRLGIRSRDRLVRYGIEAVLRSKD
jgi:hypothetical protein